MAKRGRKKKAISMSSEASRVFQQSTTLLEMGLTSVDEEEKPAILKLQSEAAIQRLYCNCRGNLEEAFLLWETGDLQSSRQKFVSARETLEKIRFEISQREDLVENPDLITGLSKVLELVQLLEDARVEDPDLYWEVSRLFVNFRLVYDAPIGVDEYEYRQTVRRNLPYGMKIVLGRMTGSEDRKVSVLYLFRIVKKEFVRYPEKGEPGRLLHALGDLIDFPTRKVGALKKAISRGLRDLRNLSPPFLKSDGKESRITPEGNAWLNRKIRQLRRITPPSSR